MTNLPEKIFEGKNFLAFFKPAGLLIEPTKNSTQKTFLDFLKQNYPEHKNFDKEKYGLVHRLDKETSGIVLVAKNKETFLKLKELFKQRKIKKEYLALVYGWPKNKKGEINLPIGWGGKLKTASLNSRNQKQALTKYFLLEKFEKNNQKYSFLKVEPKTGRTNQIRVHLAKIGLPIVGDKLYGRKKNIPKEIYLNRHFLHAFLIEFSFKNTRFKIENPLPDDLNIFLKDFFNWKY